MADVEPEDEESSENSHSARVKEISDALSASSLIGTENDEDAEPETLYAIGDFVGVGQDQLSFCKGEALKIINKCSEHWWWAECKGVEGYVPVNHLSHTSLQQFMWEDEEYFGSYGKLKLHHEMLSDQPRTLAYQQAIKDNAHLMKDKVILDVGCGTGILSLMCAKYGQPKQVYAVEASDMADCTSDVVSNNGLSHLITVKHSYVEDLFLDEPVDLIISEWMGTLLLFEMMVESVLIARDKFLGPGGVVWPSLASLFLVPVTATDQYRDCIEFWSDQYGFDLSSLRSVAVSEFLHKPNHSFTLHRNKCLAREVKLLELDISSITVADLEEIICPFKFLISQSDQLNGFCTWFQVDFVGLSDDISTTFLNTGPDYDQTHWKQNLFLLDSKVAVKEGDILQGQAKLYRNKEWRRHIRMLLMFTHTCKDSGQSTDYEKHFYIWR